MASDPNSNPSSSQFSTNPPSNSLSPYSVRLPEFDQTHLSLWLDQVDSVACDFPVSARFNILARALPLQHLARLGELPPDRSSPSAYPWLFSRIKEVFLPSPEKRVRELLKNLSLGDRTPSELLAHVRKTLTDAGVQSFDSLVRPLLMDCFPKEIHGYLLSLKPDVPLDEIADLATRLIESFTGRSSISMISPAPSAVSPSFSTFNFQPMAAALPSISAVSYPQHSNSGSNVPALSQAQRLAALETKVDSMSCTLLEIQRSLQTLLHRPSPTFSAPSSDRRSRSHSRRRSPHPAGTNTSGFCWYHRNYGATARHCDQPCNYQGNSQTGA